MDLKRPSSYSNCSFWCFNCIGPWIAGAQILGRKFMAQTLDTELNL